MPKSDPGLGLLDDIGRRQPTIAKRLSKFLRVLPSRLTPQIDQTGLLTAPTLHVDALQLAGKWGKALETARIGVAKCDHSWEAWLALSRALAFYRHRKQAQQALRRAIRLGASGPEVSLMGAILSLNDEEALDLALDAAESALALHGIPYADALFLVGKIARETSCASGKRSSDALLERIKPLMDNSVLLKMYKDTVKESA